MKHKNDEEVKEWFIVAERDLQTVEILLQHPDLEVYDVVCFHCQQAAEKYLKALMIYFDEEPPRTHDLAYLIELLSKKDKRIIGLNEVIKLNEYAVNYRYPDHLEIDDIAIAKEALELAKKVKIFVLDNTNDLKI